MFPIRWSSGKYLERNDPLDTASGHFMSYIRACGASLDVSCHVVGERMLILSSSGSRCNHLISSIAHGVGIKDLHASEVQPFRDLPAGELVSYVILCFSRYS